MDVLDWIGFSLLGLGFLIFLYLLWTLDE